MSELCYDIKKHRSTAYLCVCRKESPYELGDEDRKLLFDLVGSHNVSEIIECLYECIDAPLATGIDISEIMRTSGIERGGQATAILEWAVEEGYCKTDEDDDEDDDEN